MANVKKRNHYLTRQFLEGFCDSDGRVWTYPKFKPSDPYSNKPDSTAIQNKLYHLKNNENINAVEDYFSDEVETPASYALQNLLEKKFPNPQEKERLSLFFGMLMARMPSHLEKLDKQQSDQVRALMVSSALNKEGFYDSYKKVRPKINEKAIEAYRQSILNNDFSYQSNCDLILKIMLDSGSIYASLLLRMKWTLIETDNECPFIVSDNFHNIDHLTLPHGFYKTGLATPGAIVHFPISSRLSLMLFNGNDEKINEGAILTVQTPIIGDNGQKIDLKQLIKTLNKNIFIRSYEYIFANSNSEKLKRCFSNILKRAKRYEDNL